MKTTNIFPLRIIITAAIILIVVRISIIDIMRISGRSMEPTLNTGDILLINRCTYGFQLPFINHYLFHWHKPQKGDIVIVKNPLNDKLLVKRCIGVEGDTIRLTNGYLLIGNEKVPSKLNGDSSFKNITMIPADNIFILGDNLNHSIDSRDFGLINTDRILGTILMVF